MKKFLKGFAMLCMVALMQSAYAQKGAIEDGTIIATISFQGYTETSPVFGS